MEPTPAPRALVAARLLAVAGSVLVLGAGAHVIAGGAAPSPVAVLFVAVLVLPVAAVVARRPLTVPVLLPVAVAAQVGVHAVLTWLGSGAGVCVAAGATGADGAAGVDGAAGAGGVLSAHPGHGAVVVGAPVVHAGAGHGITDGLPMLLAHVAAMVVTVLLLVATERGLVALAHGWTAVLPALLGVRALPVPTGAAPIPVGAVRRPPLAVLRSGVGRRGPPALGPLATAA